jgi:HD-GYP domain-containing protein (c-di-GMP phosphodiesterase class II)
VVHKGPRWEALDGAPFRPDGEEVCVAALLELVEETVPDVAAHMERTARLARVFALELGLSGALLHLVVRTARVHDVGKLAIPPWVLEKPGPLTRSERALMEAHSATGQKILERKPALLSLGPLVRATHERWDGNGYPDRLKGSSIPLPSRIVAVCDAFDAMTNPRAYRTSLTIDTALEELRRGSGTQFDPGVVQPFCALFEKRFDRWAYGA